MKRFLALLLTLTLVLSLAACGEGGAPADNDDEPQISGQQGQDGSETAQDGADVMQSPTDGSTPAGADAEIDQSQVYEAWAALVGYWHAAGGRFFLLDMADSHSAWFEEGIWETSYGRSGYVTGLSLASDTIHQGVVHYDAVEATEMDDARPAEEAALQVDWTDREQDGKIRITIGGETFQCAYAGATRKEAYAVHQQNLGGGSDYAGSVEELWMELEGCWEANGEYFVEFSFRDGEPAFLSGLWEQPIPVGRPAGKASSLVTFEGFYNVCVTYPALEEAADEQDLRTYRYTVMIGVEELDAGYISVEAPDTPQYTYTRCGDSYQAVRQERQ